MLSLVCSSRKFNSFWFLKYILLEMHSYVFIESANGQVLSRKEWQTVFQTKMLVVFQVQLLMLHMSGGIHCVFLCLLFTSCSSPLLPTTTFVSVLCKLVVKIFWSLFPFWNMQRKSAVIKSASCCITSVFHLAYVSIFHIWSHYFHTNTSLSVSEQTHQQTYCFRFIMSEEWCITGNLAFKDMAMLKI